MLKKFLQTSKLSLIIGLCVYGAASQQVLGGTTTMGLPSSEDLEKASGRLLSVSKESTDEKTQSFHGFLLIPATAKDGNSWSLLAKVSTLPSPYVKGSTAPKLTPQSWQVGSTYTNLDVKYPKENYGTIWLRATPKFNLNDPNWKLDEDQNKSPTVQLELNHSAYPPASTTVKVDSKNSTFIVETK
jgi:hypothetical protein